WNRKASSIIATSSNRRADGRWADDGRNFMPCLADVAGVIRPSSGIQRLVYTGSGPRSRSIVPARSCWNLTKGRHGAHPWHWKEAGREETHGEREKRHRHE